MALNALYMLPAVILCCVMQASSDDVKSPTRIVKRSGWVFPGQQSIAGKTPKSKVFAILNGVTVEIATFSDLPVWSKKDHRYLVSKVVFASVAGDSIIFDERELVASEVTRYSVGNRPFLFTMLAYPCSEDSRTRVGGCAGADVKLAYYDEDGNGTFEVMETVNSIVSPNQSQNWRPRIPLWVAALASGR